ncbi:MAG: hypothetical protein JOS17DRAFT_786746 [Linnemannia elongata]|nr:MAG: hypothetical protein JOS17DRAFT_786746 [Linnemannia elongata]
MGVMIQCETCKVWQHCPCVGLGDGLVTPDKYYCDSCRPENHPYHVVDGVLMTNAENTSIGCGFSESKVTQDQKLRQRVQDVGQIETASQIPQHLKATTMATSHEHPSAGKRPTAPSMTLINPLC